MLRTKKKKTSLGRYSQSKKLQEPSEPSLSLSGVVQLQTQRPCPKERQVQIPGPHLPKSSSDCVKRSTLSQVSRRRRAKMQGEELICLELGRQKGKESNSPPKMGEEGGRRKDGEREKK